MKKMISGWKHSKGVHCGSSAIRDVCRRSGHDFSEQMCFGLGGGLGFYYTRDRNTDPSRLIHLRGPMMEVSFLRNFGLDVRDWKYEDDPARAMDDLVGLVAGDVPVLIQTDIRYLDYYDSSTHFPGHVVAGLRVRRFKARFLRGRQFVRGRPARLLREHGEVEKLEGRAVSAFEQLAGSRSLGKGIRS